MNIVENAMENQESSEEKEKFTSTDESDCLLKTSKDNSNWCYMPDSILLNIFQYLTPKELTVAGETCKSWHRMSYDEFLWKGLFYRTYEINPVVGIVPGKTSWFKEFKRLAYHVPLMQTEELNMHYNEVLHISFSHNGKMFATCSKDSCIIVWESQYPVKMKYRYNLRSFRWESTIFSQFNSSDTLLLVSGRLVGSSSSSSGEVAVFSLTPDFNLQCRAANTPYDVLSTWFSEHFFCYTSLYWLDIEYCNTILWLSKANQESSSENIPIIKQLFKFPTSYPTEVHEIMFANCLTPEKQEYEEETISLSDDRLPTLADTFIYYFKYDGYFHYINPLQFNQEYNSQNKESFHTENSQQHKENIHTEENNIDEIANCCEKYLIFTTGDHTTVPHQIAFKRIKDVKFPTSATLGPSCTLTERIREKKLEKEKLEILLNSDLQLHIHDIINDFDDVNKVINVYGHIMGMALSPDHRYLYVNIKPWPEGAYWDENSPAPPIAEGVDIRVIDLVTLTEVGRMARVQTAYTKDLLLIDNIFLDVCDDYIASGTGNNDGYIWDRYYGVPLVKFHHSNTVNSVAFNPCDPEMLVTASNDDTVKIWRSRSKVHELQLNENFYPKGTEVQYKNKHSTSSDPDLSTSNN